MEDTKPSLLDFLQNLIKNSNPPITNTDILDYIIQKDHTEESLSKIVNEIKDGHRLVVDNCTHRLYPSVCGKDEVFCLNCDLHYKCKYCSDIANYEKDRTIWKSKYETVITKCSFCNNTITWTDNKKSA